MAALVEVHARQLRALLEHLDVAYGVAVTSTNGERNMRPRGREVEKRVGSALPVTPKNEKFQRKSGLVRNSERNLPPEDSPVTSWQPLKFTLVSCVHFSSTLMSPAE